MEETHGSPGPRSGHAAAGGLVPAGSVPSQRCSARRSNGDPCKRWAIVGGNVCPTHGGSAPQVRRAALARILELAPLALREQQKILESPDAPAAVKARVADSILDRIGLKPADVLVTADTEEEADDRIGRSIEAALRARGYEVIEGTAKDA